MFTLEQLYRGERRMRYGKIKAKMIKESKPFPKGAIMASVIHNAANAYYLLKK